MFITCIQCILYTCIHIVYNTLCSPINTNKYETAHPQMLRKYICPGKTSHWLAQCARDQKSCSHKLYNFKGLKIGLLNTIALFTELVVHQTIWCTNRHQKFHLWSGLLVSWCPTGGESLHGLPLLVQHHCCSLAARNALAIHCALVHRTTQHKTPDDRIHNIITHMACLCNAFTLHWCTRPLLVQNSHSSADLWLVMVMVMVMEMRKLWFVTDLGLYISIL